MTGRRATQILNGPSSRPVRAALAAVLAAGNGGAAARPIAREPVPVRARTVYQGHCARCGAELPPRRLGVRGRRFCKDRYRCRQAAGGRQPRGKACAMALETLCTRLLGVLPATRKAARSVPELLVALPGITDAQLRRALRSLVRSRRVGAAWLLERSGPTGGRPPKGYWSTRP